MKDKLYAVLALASFIAAGYFFYTYVNQENAESASSLPFVGVIIFAPDSAYLRCTFFVWKNK